MKRISLALLLAIVFAVFGCADTSAQTDQNLRGKKALVAFFSRADENYDVGYVAKGNTQILAQMIAAKINAPLFHIQTIKPYPKEYKPTTDIAKQEQRENARPELTAKVENMGEYDVIFLGYPIWWSDLPMAVYTFLQSYDFKDKTIIPFATHEGSGLSGTDGYIAKATGAKVSTPLVIQGKIAQNSQDEAQKEVDSWLKKLGFID